MKVSDNVKLLADTVDNDAVTWRKGTVGVIVDRLGGRWLVQIYDEQGNKAALLAINEEDLERIPSQQAFVVLDDDDTTGGFEGSHVILIDEENGLDEQARDDLDNGASRRLFEPILYSLGPIPGVHVYNIADSIYAVDTARELVQAISSYRGTRLSKEAQDLLTKLSGILDNVSKTNRNEGK